MLVILKLYLLAPIQPHYIALLLTPTRVQWCDWDCVAPGRIYRSGLYSFAAYFAPPTSSAVRPRCLACEYACLNIGAHRTFLRDGIGVARNLRTSHALLADVPCAAILIPSRRRKRARRGMDACTRTGAPTRHLFLHRAVTVSLHLHASPLGGAPGRELFYLPCRPPAGWKAFI